MHWVRTEARPPSTAIGATSPPPEDPEGSVGGHVASSHVTSAAAYRHMWDEQRSPQVKRGFPP